MSSNSSQARMLKGRNETGNLYSSNSEVAKCLAVEGGTLVFLDVPARTEFGIDMNVFTVGEKFKGVKMIPPGLHFVFYSAVSRDDCTAPRTGFFHFFKSGELVVKKWNKLNEDIDDSELNDEEMDRIKSHIHGDLDKHLGAYPYNTWKKWISLTNHISESIMERLQPECKKVSSVTPLVSLQYPPEEAMETSSDTVVTKKPKNPEDKLLPNMKPIPGTEIRFTSFEMHSYPKGSTPAQITHFCMDSTYSLERVMESYANPSDILGELQLSFVCFLIGQVFEAFEQWKHLVDLFTSCDEALSKYTDLYMDLITVLHFQLKEVPSDFFVDIVSSDNFLTVTLQRFFQNITESSANEQLKIRAGKFKESVKKTFKWDFDWDPDDEAPTVVEFPDEQPVIVTECEQ